MTAPLKNLKIAAGCAVCTEAILEGEIKIGAGTVIHPRAHILAEAGPIILGEGNLIEENAQIINRHPSSSPLIIGNHNVFEIGCRFEGCSIGDNNVFEIGASIGPKVTITNGCTIGPKCSLLSEEVIPENSVIYGASYMRKINPERPAPPLLQLEYLKKTLPNFHYLHAPTS